MDRAELKLSVPEMTVLVGGLRVLGANVGQSKNGVFTIFDPPGATSSEAGAGNPSGAVVGGYTNKWWEYMCYRVSRIPARARDVHHDQLPSVYVYVAFRG